MGKIRLNSQLYIKRSLTAVALILVLGGYGKSVRQLHNLSASIESMRQDIQNQNSRIDKLNNRVDKLYKELDKQKSECAKLSKQLKEKSAFRDRVSSAIQKTSEGTKKPEADKLARAIDEVADEFKKVYGYPRNIPRMLAIISVESDFRNLKPNDAYAIGYAQVTPPCLNEVNKLAGWKYTMNDMYDVKSNLRVAWYMINRDIVKFGDDKAIVAYNQGYRHLTRSVNYCLTDKTSYLYKVNAKTEKYKELLKEE